MMIDVIPYPSFVPVVVGMLSSCWLLFVFVDCVRFLSSGLAPFYDVMSLSYFWS